MVAALRVMTMLIVMGLAGGSGLMAAMAVVAGLVLAVLT